MQHISSHVTTCTQNHDAVFWKWNFCYCGEEYRVCDIYNAILSHHSKTISRLIVVQKCEKYKIIIFCDITFLHTAFHTISHCWQLGNVFLKWDKTRIIIFYTTEQKRERERDEIKTCKISRNLNNFQLWKLFSPPTNYGHNLSQSIVLYLIVHFPFIAFEKSALDFQTRHDKSPVSFSTRKPHALQVQDSFPFKWTSSKKVALLHAQKLLRLEEKLRKRKFAFFAFRSCARLQHHFSFYDVVTLSLSFTQWFTEKSKDFSCRKLKEEKESFCILMQIWMLSMGKEF